MGKYLKTKKGSIESAVLEAMSPAQQAAIAISKKEKGEKPKNEEKTECPKCEGDGCDHCDGKGYHTTEELSAKQKKIDLNKNGKVDGDDLKKLRAKADKKEETVVEKTEYVEYKFKNKNDAMAAKKYFDGIQLMGFDVNDDGASQGELAVDAGNKDMTKYHKEIMKKFSGVKVVTTEKKEPAKEVTEQVETLAQKAAKAISDMWAEASKSPKKEEEETPKKKESKKTTMTGKPMSDIEINPKSEEK
jgi:hypothetical protein